MEAKKSKKASFEGLRGIFFECGLIVGLALMILAFSWSSDGPSSVLGDFNRGAIIPEDDVINTDPDDAIPPPPPEILQPVITDEIIITDDPNITNVSMFNPEDFKAPVVEVPYVKPKEQVKEQVIDEPDIDYGVVQEKPKFMGGDANNFSKWVTSKIVYPTIDQENNVQGKVILQFRIGSDGTLENIKVLRSISPGLDKEAIRVVSSSPKWTPGKHNNKPVGVIYTFPVNFVLTN